MSWIKTNRRGAGQISLSAQAEWGFLGILKSAAAAALKEAAMTTPQYSGDLAANWRLSINRARPGTASAGTTGSPAYEGHPAAVVEAINSPGAKLSALRVGDTVYLSTWGEHKNEIGSDGARDSYTEGYAGLVEREQITFRNVNPSRGHILARARLAFQLSVRADSLGRRMRGAPKGRR